MLFNDKPQASADMIYTVAFGLTLDNDKQLSLVPFDNP